MTKKDFELIAEVIAGSCVLSHNQRVSLGKEFARALNHTNSRFDVQRFIRACVKEYTG